MENHERVESRELLEQCDQVKCFAWLQRCDECIEQLEELCRAKRLRLAIGHRQSAVARIATCGCKVAIGATFRAHWWRVREWRIRDNELIWQEIDAAFESRTLTGAVITLIISSLDDF